MKSINNLKRDLVKATKKSEEYKKKALSEHKKLNQVKQSFNAMKVDFENSKRKLEVELANTQKRLQEVERSRDLLMTGSSNSDHAELGMDATDSAFDVVAKEDKEHQNELKKYLDRLDAM